MGVWKKNGESMWVYNSITLSLITHHNVNCNKSCVIVCGSSITHVSI